MKLVFDRSISLKEASFSARIHGQDLALPMVLERVLQVGLLTNLTAEDLLGLSYSFPGTLGQLLGWSLDQVETARCELVSQLEGYIEDIYLLPPKTPRGGKPPG